ncbi:hypothetical protein [Spiroplasma cantharicola]|uniref:Uncharacterized protein n=1 Tax=Spiroplasma cantharicola TaxID=362837 RepID=A0A0M4JWN4_9MOLU|nr:hypothetical protein [Spiroplasma cantharicola]ALD66392.1 hypothetical protein SCANT_v1c04860 [Spiroplasma cantharicola]
MWVSLNFISDIILNIYGKRNAEYFLNKRRKKRKNKINLEKHLWNSNIRITYLKTTADQYLFNLKMSKYNRKLQIQELNAEIIKLPEKIIARNNLEKDVITKGKLLINVKEDSKYYNQAKLEITITPN